MLVLKLFVPIVDELLLYIYGRPFRRTNLLKYQREHPGEVRATKLETKLERVGKRLTKNVPPSGYGPEVWQPMDAHAVDECMKEQNAKMHGNYNILAYKVSAIRLPTRPKKNNHL